MVNRREIVKQGDCAQIFDTPKSEYARQVDRRDAGGEGAGVAGLGAGIGLLGRRQIVAALLLAVGYRL
ncbi:hypothetical protein HNQ96_004393 [Aminobacter lissarensis]|uniref:Uncharacterized protein n=1 Tax=Aminobacter carboxidus TaxID=376165 RepID=A0A8E1WIH2_9HYPH|nr:hypothetical protein [Aminobacter lissarensis]MBB6468509.1 hypothetical protein [Aminobacter lissarensis]